MSWIFAACTGQKVAAYLSEDSSSASMIGSNNWAVAGSRTVDGRAILADDMHLGLSLPNTWYRASMEWPSDDGRPEPSRITGVTLAGYGEGGEG